MLQIIHKIVSYFVTIQKWSGTVERDLKPHSMGLHAARKLAGADESGQDLSMVPRSHRRSMQRMMIMKVLCLLLCVFHLIEL